ncbi:NEDD8-activating enzyme E1 catalytic subunit-like [Rosa chinensis]|uniref:NEDD8-activating enzyme E1 catalytic subunit-like n=1 Tax=Rosa chinensis TaxID=74649 RepID=UPI001AD8B832|nr:NEDD8-activating enzyme E1 catalytic subunit-like [Rosa chinensis]
MMLMINPKKKLSTLWSMVGLKIFKDMPGSLCQGSVHACFECTIWLFPPQVKFPLCTLAEIPRTAAHCIEYAHLIKWDEVHSGEAFDPDDPEHINLTRELSCLVFKSYIVSHSEHHTGYCFHKCYYISYLCATILKIASGCSKTLSNYLTYIGINGEEIS